MPGKSERAAAAARLHFKAALPTYFGKPFGVHGAAHRELSYLDACDLPRGSSAGFT